MSDEPNFMPTGTFLIGCNYWASHAGMFMWRDWRPEIVTEDLKQLAAEGVQILRVFPLWPDFQPLTQIYTANGRRQELRMGETPLGFDNSGRAGVSNTMMERFRFLADTAGREGLQLIVGLITGWMSGRLFVPPAFETLNVITDPLPRKWQVRFVRYFVGTFRHHPAIVAWDLGNECNCMGDAGSSAAAWDWTELITGAVRQADPERPVVSGMHGLSAGVNGTWTIADQGELTDLLTTHPYPIFTPWCNQDPVDRLRNGFHAAAECRLYGDLGHRPCFAEEMGTLGPMVASELNAAAYLRGALYTLWTQDCRAMLWWCAYDQMHLRNSPYDRNAVERELGLIRNTREVKPVLGVMADFRRQIEALPFPALPPCSREAVCILTEGQDQWAAAYAAFILAKQAGFDLHFQHAHEPLIESALYLMPSLGGDAATDHRLREDLMARVRAGSSLYVSFGDAFFEPFSKFFGLEVESREMEMRNSPVRFAALPGSPTLPGTNSIRLRTRSLGAEVLGTEPDGNIVFAGHTVGNGRVYYLAFPLETMLSRTPGAFHGESAPPYYLIYRHMAAPVLAGRIVRLDYPTVTATEHPSAENTAIVVVILHAPGPSAVPMELTGGWTIETVHRGTLTSENTLRLDGNDAAILGLRRIADAG